MDSVRAVRCTSSIQAADGRLDGRAQVSPRRGYRPRLSAPALARIGNVSPNRLRRRLRANRVTFLRAGRALFVPRRAEGSSGRSRRSGTASASPRRNVPSDAIVRFAADVHHLLPRGATLRLTGAAASRQALPRRRTRRFRRKAVGRDLCAAWHASCERATHDPLSPPPRGCDRVHVRGRRLRLRRHALGRTGGHDHRGPAAHRRSTHPADPDIADQAEAAALAASRDGAHRLRGAGARPTTSPP